MDIKGKAPRLYLSHLYYRNIQCLANVKSFTWRNTTVAFGCVRVWIVGQSRTFKVHNGLRNNIISRGSASKFDWTFELLLFSNIQAELCGTNDVVVNSNCKYALEGHVRGVNWPVSTSTRPPFGFGGWWSPSQALANERDQDPRRGKLISSYTSRNANNVSCCLFHRKHDLVVLVSNSEDRSIRVWDVTVGSPNVPPREMWKSYRILTTGWTTGING